jgi:site-specific DNA recombinase
MQLQRADIEAFLQSFTELPDTLTEFSAENWHALVDYATVYSADDIRITFKHGQEIKA